MLKGIIKDMKDKIRDAEEKVEREKVR